ncbi:hypothetical protein LOTGIDRAFT_111015 [Lottia gigantea]|uniref:ribonuclease III n=1 Tax=Lottia gigantea TaxID=225164 RepID=V4BAB4_LOTGI|nr:hypothetical protein LOTGIDRAFT_111015 [Lottia gigantea]ESP02872.1 hypothetical protein LOTGIDRAFT_111015 [Lottia gigantea]
MKVDLVDSALQKNTIVCLSSSSEKLFIALMVIKELSTVLRKPLSEGGKRTIYVVNSDDTAEFQCQILSRHTNLKIGYYTIDKDTENWAKDKWQEEFTSKHVLVFTAEVILDVLTQNSLPLPQINMLIFDDCHLAVGDHSYVQIMHMIENEKVEPHVIGLTASILGSRIPEPHKLKHTITSLENIFHCTAETSMLVISERFDSRPTESVLQCFTDQSDEVVLKLNDIIDSALFFLYECNISPDTEEEPFKKDPRQLGINVLSEIRNILHQLGTWCTSRIAEILIPQIEKNEKSESCAINKRFIRFTLTQLRLIVKVFEANFNPDYDVEELLMYSTPKVRELVHMLRKYKPDWDFMIISSDDLSDDELSNLSDDNEDADSLNLSDSDYDEKDDHSPKLIHVAVKRSTTDADGQIISNGDNTDAKQLCGLVFVDQQYVALALNKFLEEVCSWDENMCFLKSQHIVGQGYRSAPNKVSIGKVYRKQEEVLRKFRMQELNLLIATKVLEHGVDIPKCNLVVRFDPPRDYKSYTLSKGRARARDSDYVILLNEENEKLFSEDLKLFKEIEEILIGKEKEKDIVEEDSSDYLDIVPKYYPTNHNIDVHVSLNNSIALINRYCAKLPSDAFTHLTPQCTISTIQHGDNISYIGHIRLPINSPIKLQIEGIAMPTKKLAQKAAAQKACEMLHKTGELDEQLQPVGKEMFLQEQQEEWDDEDVTSQGRPGTTKRKQYYFKKVAEAFDKSHPDVNKKCYLYIINMVLTGRITEEQNTRGRSIYAPEETTRCLGILSSKQIPQVPMFPVYTRSGEVTVSVDLVQSDITLDNQQLKQLQDFHLFLFTQVLHLDKDPMECNGSLADVGYLIVPVDPSLDALADIEWSFVEYVTSNNSDQKKNVFDSKRDIFMFDKEAFLDAVVMPSYRNIDQPQNFYVAEIRYDLSPLSSFPSPELYKTFNDYYSTKYGLVITNTDQPLLDVDHTSARLNLLTPRYMNQKGVALPTSSAETKRARRENLQQKQILIPELCDIHVFPASLWRKAACLPAILYRMNYLLLAEEIRLRIARETGIGVIDLPEGFRFPQLDFGFETSPDKIKLNEKSDSSSDSDSGIASSDSCLVRSESDIVSSASDASIKLEDKLVDGTHTNHVEIFNDTMDVISNKLIATNINSESNTDKPEASIPSDSSDKTVIDISDSSPDKDSCKQCQKNILQYQNCCESNVNDLKNLQDCVQNADSDTFDVGVWNSPDVKIIEGVADDKNFSLPEISLDEDRDLDTFVGPSPCLILQALTMSNANDFFSLERLETIGDSFLKYAITVYLYCSYPGIHEGKLSYLRSKQVSNYNLYRLGQKRGVAECMVSSKFEPYENWLPPCYIVNEDRRRGPVPKVLIAGTKNDKASITSNFVLEESKPSKNHFPIGTFNTGEGKVNDFNQELKEAEELDELEKASEANQLLIPYSLQTQHGIPDKSVADCSEALIGCYLTTCGKKAALMFMSWLGLKVLPKKERVGDSIKKEGQEVRTLDHEYEELSCPVSPLITDENSSRKKLEMLLNGYDEFEESIEYKFQDRSYLLQAFTHASYHYNTVTDCYQRLEFLGDAILDYVITRHLYEDSQKYSPGILTDLRSALVNNNIFAALAVKWNFHQYFKAISPALFQVIEKFVTRQKDREDEIDIDDEFNDKDEEDDDDDEEVVEMEIPKALGDIFESVAGAIYLDSGMSLDAVWTVYYRLMKPQIEKYLKCIPKSPVRELLEMEPETAKFEKPERTMDGKIRVTVNVVGKGVFSGIGRNYRIAKSAAAKKALRCMKTMQQQGLI